MNYEVDDYAKCGLASPTTGQLCTMSKGHVGPHKAGGPYHSVEDWVTQCPEGKCEYHENSNKLKKEQWLECIRCGHRKPLPKAPCHHIWFPKGEDVVGETTITYTHECPKCGKIKTTVKRKDISLPPDVKWPREITKLMERAKADGCELRYDGQPLDVNKISVLEQQ